MVNSEQARATGILEMFSRRDPGPVYEQDTDLAIPYCVVHLGEVYLFHGNSKDAH